MGEGGGGGLLKEKNNLKKPVDNLEGGYLVSQGL